MTSSTTTSEAGCARAGETGHIHLWRYSIAMREDAPQSVFYGDVLRSLVMAGWGSRTPARRAGMLFTLPGRPAAGARVLVQAPEPMRPEVWTEHRYREITRTRVVQDVTQREVCWTLPAGPRAVKAFLSPVRRAGSGERRAKMSRANDPEAWFAEKMARAGARIDGEVRMAPHPAVRGRSRPVTVPLAEFRAHVHVDDPGLLAAAVTDGIGKGKAFGAGMVLVKREGDEQ